LSEDIEEEEIRNFYQKVIVITSSLQRKTSRVVILSISINRLKVIEEERGEVSVNCFSLYLIFILSVNRRRRSIC
jgi:hypothetical protein